MRPIVSEGSGKGGRARGGTRENGVPFCITLQCTRVHLSRVRAYLAAPETRFRVASEERSPDFPDDESVGGDRGARGTENGLAVRNSGGEGS